MVHQESGFAKAVLEELLTQRKREDAGLLWKNLRLDWVRNWDHNCQTGVLLSRLQHTGKSPGIPTNTSFLLVVGDMLTLWSDHAELTSCEPVVLWRYLTALHHRRRAIDWIENSGTSHWPELTPALVNNNTVCSTYLRENILDLLAR